NRRYYGICYGIRCQLPSSATNKYSAIGSIAVDWITNKIYIVEYELARIDMLSLDEKMMKTNIIINNLYQPVAIAIDPIAEYLFVADEGNWHRIPARINRCLLDGTLCITLIDQKLEQPSDLTVDFIKQRVYWVDRSYDHVESCDYHGSRRREIALFYVFWDLLLNHRFT
ncbi:unnamed protein product, partial [Rotaria sp. Silwood2]